ncbi:beta-1,3-glucan-binding protein-like [Elysia marginata]|uniref:Beta-1,3-glucan-binding protein-like n=1 Tax=Elysia marginata TaxID=1093978 RepID=A0AAV4HPQ8_9GAST|nr:beta-1,3-glucan-binding protein-like [Elysia marginata]
MGYCSTRFSGLLLRLALLISTLTITAVHGVSVDISGDTSGILFKIPDEGFSLVGLHYSINRPLAGVAAGDVNVDITSSTGDDASQQASGKSDPVTSQNSGCTCTGSNRPADPYNKEASCTSYPCLIFEDEFDTLDCKLWEHEITAGGGGVGSNSYTTSRIERLKDFGGY